MHNYKLSQPSLEDKIYASIDDSNLNLILLPTEKCNFRCFYCYEDFKIGRMSKQVIKGIKNLLLSRFQDLQKLEISWFGGEPLMAKDIIYDIHDFISLNAPTDLVNFGSITTNAYLLDEQTLEKLIKRNINLFQISIDGDEEQHNKTRYLSNNKPTFNTIWDNLLNMKNSNYDFKVMLRIHFTYENYLNLDNLIKKINMTFCNDDRFNIYFKAVERLGGINDNQIKKFTYLEKKEIKNNLDNKIESRSQIFNLETEESPYMCYASKANSFVIRADGRIGKCTVALNNEKNTVGILNEDGEFAINENFYYWIKGIETLDKQMLACPLSKLDYRIKSSDK